MSQTKFTIRDDFPPASYQQWRALAEADLKGATFEQKLVTQTYEGIAIQPLYTQRDQLPDAELGLPGCFPFVRGARPAEAACEWDLRPEYAHPDLQETNRAILEDLQGGVTSVLLRFDAAARLGLDADDAAAIDKSGRDGIASYSAADLEAAIGEVELPLVGIAFEAGAAFAPAAAMLVALWQQRGVPHEKAHGAFNADPIGVLAREGHLPYSTDKGLALVAQLAVWTAKHLPRVRAVGVDTSAYHNAGAATAQDIAFSVATGVEYLRAMASAGLDLDSAAQQITFNFSLGTHHFLAIAKLRAARWLWARVLQASGGSAPSGGMNINARTSRRVLTQRDPYVNLLRNTVGIFAAVAGGANSVTSLPFDAMLGLPDARSRRIARNTALILQEEAHLGHVADPAGGSWFIDRLTKQIAEKAWQVLQQVEARGGMVAALNDGWIAEQINAAFAPRAKNISRRKEGITGVSEFPDVAEEEFSAAAVDSQKVRAAAIERVAKGRQQVRMPAAMNEAGTFESAVAAAKKGASIGQISRMLGFGRDSVEIKPLPFRPFAEPFEALRTACDAWEQMHGKRPSVFLANMGRVSDCTARATYSKNFFEAGGFAVITSDGFADATAAAEGFQRSEAQVAVICSSDKLYPELVPLLASKLKQAGANMVVLAGNPGGNEENWRAAGVDQFVFIKCDVLSTLREILHELGVISAGESSTSSRKYVPEARKAATT